MFQNGMKVFSRKIFDTFTTKYGIWAFWRYVTVFQLYVL